jgi:hypothetical protein
LSEIIETEELAYVAKKIEVERSSSIIEEHLPEFQVQEGNLVGQLVAEFYDEGSADEEDGIAIEVENDEPIQKKREVISITEAQQMIAELIAFAKAIMLFNEEFDLLGLKATIKAPYNSSLKQPPMDRYFQWKTFIPN